LCPSPSKRRCSNSLAVITAAVPTSVPHRPGSDLAGSGQETRQMVKRGEEMCAKADTEGVVAASAAGRRRRWPYLARSAWRLGKRRQRGRHLDANDAGGDGGGILMRTALAATAGLRVVGGPMALSVL
jgi:hypothetical protein